MENVIKHIPKLQKGTIRFVIPDSPSIRSSANTEQLGSHWTDFHVRVFLDNLSREFKFH